MRDILCLVLITLGYSAIRSIASLQTPCTVPWVMILELGWGKREAVNSEEESMRLTAKQQLNSDRDWGIQGGFLHGCWGMHGSSGMHILLGSLTKSKKLRALFGWRGKD